MFSFVNTAYAMPPGGASGANDGIAVLSQFFPLILIFLIFWVFVIRPQQKRAKQHRDMVSNLKKGDEVFTDSGIRGTIMKVAEDHVTLEIAPKVAVHLIRTRVADLVKEAKGQAAKGGNEDSKTGN
ncbi:MAG: preprotein translocase subunit YajC [Deltaproteobacteria bacterium]|nr:preprotein translocase subunit YajC [Deltaproteobacteria bacterium]